MKQRRLRSTLYEDQGTLFVISSVNFLQLHLVLTGQLGDAEFAPRFSSDVMLDYFQQSGKCDLSPGPDPPPLAPLSLEEQLNCPGIRSYG